MEVDKDFAIQPCSFQFHEFKVQVGEVRIHCELIIMDKSIYIWVGNYDERTMTDLSLAFIMKKNKANPVVSTKIMGPIAEDVSTNIAIKLSKYFGKVVYLSFNLNVDYLMLPSIERRIHEELKNHPELLPL